MASYTTAPHHELSESDIFSRGTRTFGWFSPRIAHSASTSFHSRITFTACASAGAPPPCGGDARAARKTTPKLPLPRTEWTLYSEPF